MNRIWKHILFGAPIAMTLAFAGCASTPKTDETKKAAEAASKPADAAKADHPEGEHPKGEHPEGEHPKGEHPEGEEHPKKDDSE
jgi:hypothetical protein